jgi:hypothetical protein
MGVTATCAAVCGRIVWLMEGWVILICCYDVYYFYRCVRTVRFRIVAPMLAMLYPRNVEVWRRLSISVGGRKDESKVKNFCSA